MSVFCPHQQVCQDPGASCVCLLSLSTVLTKSRLLLFFSPLSAGLSRPRSLLSNFVLPSTALPRSRSLLSNFLLPVNRFTKIHAPFMFVLFLCQQVFQDPGPSHAASVSTGQGEAHPPVHARRWGWETVDTGDDATCHSDQLWQQSSQCTAPHQKEPCECLVCVISTSVSSPQILDQPVCLMEVNSKLRKYSLLTTEEMLVAEVWKWRTWHCFMHIFDRGWTVVWIEMDLYHCCCHVSVCWHPSYCCCAIGVNWLPVLRLAVTAGGDREPRESHHVDGVNWLPGFVLQLLQVEIENNKTSIMPVV